MLSIGKLATGQASYYERQVARGRDDYYSGRGEAPGEWLGRGSGLLGLEGTVVAAQFNALMAGLDPSDPQLERSLRDSRGEPKVVGWDLTFSAPKSVSVLFATADETTSGQLIAAHEAAVRAALAYVEDEAIKVRRGKGGLQVERGAGVVAAAYRHRMSRALDPQLHTHVVAANMARGPDGRWTALDGRALYQHAKTAGYLYQAHLRAEVRDRLGLEWGAVNKGAAELVGVPAEVLAEFSRRRQAIVEAAREAGVGDLATDRGKYLAVATRDRKQYGVETHAWRDEIRARAAEHGLDRAAITQLFDDPADVAPAAADDTHENALGDHLAGPDGLTRDGNTFVERDVLREYAAAARTGARVDEVRAQGARFAGREDVRATVGGALTTEDLIASERRLVAAAIGRAGAGVGLVGDADRRRALAAAELPLTEQQAAAVTAVVQSGNGVDVIEALAGTGKTFTAGMLRRVYEDAGYHVVGVAPTGRAVRELAEEAGVPAWTLDRTLIDLRHTELAPDTIVLFDEAGMAATRSSEQLLAAAARVNAKVIAIGDSGQLPSVQAGGWMRAVGDRLGHHQLTEVMRQRDVDERRALARLHGGHPAGYLEWADRESRITIHTGDALSAAGAALSDWRGAVAEHGAAAAVLIARDNDTRAALNIAARAHWRDSGRLGDERDYGAVTVAVGDRIICRRNDRFADVDNGTRGTVRSVTDDRVVIETDAGSVRELPAAYVAEHVEHAYCLTGHGMQGGTVEHATVLARPRELSRGWSYTALSRARGATQLHIDGGDVPAAAVERADVAPAERQPRPERQEVLERVTARMKVRDDEDLAIEQLPRRAAPGRPDDALLQRGDVPAAALPEAGAEALAGDRTPSLADVRAELSSLAAQRAALPLRELRQLDATARERADVARQRDELAARLAALPERDRGLLGRGRDPRAAERARLQAAVAAAGQQLVALDAHAARLVEQVGPVDQLREERSGFDSRILQLERQATRIRDELADRVVAAPPAWATALFGARPESRRAADQYDRGVREVARYRLEHDVDDDLPGLGEPPDDDRGRASYRQLSGVVRQVQRQLGRDVERDRGLERG